MNKIMGDFFYNIRLSIIPSPSSRQMKNNTFSIQYNDQNITKSISRMHEGLFRSWAEILAPFSNLSRVLDYCWLLLVGLFERLELWGLIIWTRILFPS